MPISEESLADWKQICPLHPPQIQLKHFSLTFISCYVHVCLLFSAHCFQIHREETGMETEPKEFVVSQKFALQAGDKFK